MFAYEVYAVIISVYLSSLKKLTTKQYIKYELIPHRPTSVLFSLFVSTVFRCPLPMLSAYCQHSVFCYFSFLLFCLFVFSWVSFQSNSLCRLPIFVCFALSGLVFEIFCSTVVFYFVQEFYVFTDYGVFTRALHVVLL